MNKKELVKKVADRTQMSQKNIEEFLAVTMEEIEEEVGRGGKVQLFGFGTFERRNRAERKQRAFGTGKYYKTKACKVPKFSAGQGFKDKVNESAN